MKLIPKLYNANIDKRYAIHQGGQGSGKTRNNLYYCNNIALRYPNKVISVVSESLPHLRRGCIRDMHELLKAENLSHFVDELKNPNVITYPNGSSIEFFGADADSKMLGARRDILFANECNGITYNTFRQLDNRSKKTILDFNPRRKFWVHTELIPHLEEKDFNFVKSTYEDNPFLSPEEKDNILRARHDERWWRVYGMGEIGEYEGVVFTNWEIQNIKELPGTLIGYGIDFGFVNSKTAVVQVNEYEGNLYVRELLYKVGLFNEQILEHVQKIGIDLNAQAIGDGAEPKSIEWLFRNGWRGLKGTGSKDVEYRIAMLTQRKIIVSADSLNLINEMRNLLWAKDKDGVTMNRPEKNSTVEDHLIDAFGYIAIQKPKKKISFY